MAGTGERVLTGGHAARVVLKFPPSIEITASQDGSCKNNSYMLVHLSDVEHIIGGN